MLRNFNVNTKHADYQNLYKNRQARVITERDGLVLYDVVDNGKTIVFNNVLSSDEFNRRYI